MNKLIENSYVISLVLTLGTIILFPILGILYVSESWTNSQTPITDLMTYIVWYPLILVTILSYVLAFIHAVKQSRVALTIIYGFILIAVVMISILFLLPI